MAHTDIAVLMCTHNGARYLRSQLDSIYRQSAAPRALFVHDWGSSDGTVEILEAFSKIYSDRFPVFVHVHDAAPGPCRSFLLAIEEVIASEHPFGYLALCDQDDVWAPKKLEIYNDIIRDAEDPPRLLCSDVSLIDESGRLLSESFYSRNGVFREPRSILDPSILLFNPIVGMTLCMSRSALRDLSPAFVENWIMHDWALVILVALHRWEYRFVAQPLVAYRQHAANVLGASQGSRLIERLKKSGAHFQRVRRQIRCANMYVTRLTPALENSLAIPNASRRLQVARTAVRSPLLAPMKRLALGAAIILFW